MKLFLTLGALLVLSVSAQAQASDWDMQPDVCLTPVVMPQNAPNLTALPCTSFESTGTQWDVSSLQAPQANTDSASDSSAGASASGSSPYTNINSAQSSYVANSCTQTGQQQVTGLQQCSTSILAPVAGPTSANGLPQCSLATCIKD